MKIKLNELREDIKSKLNQLDVHIPIRIRQIFDDLHADERDGEVELFDILVRLILKADEGPASLISNLLSLVDSENISQLDQWTISNSATYLRDFLKRDYILYILEKREKKENTEVENSKDFDF